MLQAAALVLLAGLARPDAAYPSPWRTPANARVSVADGGAIVFTFPGTSKYGTTRSIALESSFSEPGPSLYNLSITPSRSWTSLAVHRADEHLGAER
jgi:hypothetical protein